MPISSSNGATGGNSKRTILIVVGFVVGIFFLYLAFKDISFRDFVDGVKQMKPIYLIPCALLMMLLQLLRAVRFGIIIRPFCPLSTKRLWDLLNLWAAATMIMPARLGELVRPYLLQRCGASFSSTLAAVMVERFFDLSGLLLLLGLVLWNTDRLPHQFTVIGQVLLAMLALGYATVLVILARRQQVQALVTRLASRLPVRVASFVEGMSMRLIEGLGIMASFRQAVMVFSCSILLWVLFSLMTYLFLLAFHMNGVTFLVAVTIQVFICFGVAVAPAPGFIGTFHAAGRYALALFGIQAALAVSFATVYHLFSLIACLLLGLISYWTSDFRFDHAIFSPSQSESSDGGRPEELLRAGEFPLTR